MKEGQGRTDRFASGASFRLILSRDEKGRGVERTRSRSYEDGSPRATITRWKRRGKERIQEERERKKRRERIAKCPKLRRGRLSRLGLDAPLSLIAFQVQLHFSLRPPPQHLPGPASSSGSVSLSLSIFLSLPVAIELSPRAVRWSTASVWVWYAPPQTTALDSPSSRWPSSTAHRSNYPSIHSLQWSFRFTRSSSRGFPVLDPSRSLALRRARWSRRCSAAAP